MSNLKKTLLIVVCCSVFVVWGLLNFKQAEVSKLTIQSGEVANPTVSLGQAVKKAEQSTSVNKQVKQKLVDQGYPADAVDSLLSQGAQKASSLKNIASVEKSYGTPWNEPLHVGDYTLKGLYLVGNEEEHRFVLGQYEDKTGERVIFIHMSKTEPISTLQAGLVYSNKQVADKYTAYLNAKGNVVGIQFAVEINNGKGVVNYVATTTGTLTQTDIDSFISSVVDGSII